MFGGKLTQLAGHWNALSRDARWAVLSAAERKGNRWDDESFWATGVADVDAVLGQCEGLKFGRALDFGCGVGRLSRALAHRFEQVDGVDVSLGMVEQAQQSAPPNVKFHENPWPHLKLFSAASFDFGLSLMTLQHMQPSLMEKYLAEFGRVLKPGALLYVQIPELPRARFSSLRLRTVARRLAFKAPGVKRLWKWRKGELPLEMYGLRQTRVEQVLRRAGFQVLKVEAEQFAGDDWHSLHYLARRS